jgi:hypothetical protein
MYRELRAQWWRRVLPRARLVLWPIMGLSLLGVFLTGVWAWLAGALFGGMYAVWLEVREDVPRHIQNWRTGAEGERMAEKRLLPLEEAGWFVAHDLESRSGNVDHVVIGPPGVFILDSKKRGGAVTVDNGVPTVTPLDNPDWAWSDRRLAGKLRGVCAGNSAAIHSRIKIKPWIQPVVVIWAPFEAGVVKSAGVVFVQGDHLAEWLRSQPPRCSVDEQRRLASAFGLVNSPA